MNLPSGYRIMNPFAVGKALRISTDFYRKFYSDKAKRRLIFGINPGRHGAGITGVPFTDSVHLERIGLDTHGIKTREPSAKFIYLLIDAYGGAERFYRNFYINSPMPLGLLVRNSRGNLVNANYYDNPAIKLAASPLISYSMEQYRQMPIELNTVFCLGQGKNFTFLSKWNERHKFCNNLVALPHPRYIVQYKTRFIQDYVKEYLQALSL